MPNEYTFYASFNEFTPVYRDIQQVWIADGTQGSGPPHGVKGSLYAAFGDGASREIGSVTLFPLAQQYGYQGTEEQWFEALNSAAAATHGATATSEYASSESGVTPPETGWTSTPSPTEGEYLWGKITLTWMDSTTSVFYTVSYIAEDSSVLSVNGLTGDVVLHGDNVLISGNDNETIKSYIDNLVFEPDVATDAEIDALFEST